MDRIEISPTPMKV